jgi:Polyketide cyclase / dehydrase and lipid transport
VRKGIALSQLSIAYGRQRITQTRETGEAPLHFYAELFVDQSPAVVWSYFVDLAKWMEWSPVCYGCRLKNNDRLQLDSVLEIRLRFFGVSIMIPARIVQFNPPEAITWQGQKFGIDATHTYRFIPHNQGTLLCNEETISGTRFSLSKLIAVWYRRSDLGCESLKGLKRELGKTTLGTVS